jgi:hypothetical protein
VVRAGLVGAAAGGAFVGLAVVLGAAVLVVAAALFGTAPATTRATTRACARWLRAAWASPTGQLEVAGSCLAYTGLGLVPIQTSNDLCLLTDEQLCEAWRSSTSTLRVGLPHRLRRTVERRQWYLDEFERRNPEGLRMWLASTDAIACDPLRYLVERWVDVPTADWDELTRGQGA